MPPQKYAAINASWKETGGFVTKNHVQDTPHKLRLWGGNMILWKRAPTSSTSVGLTGIST